jgi:AbrB family looped-hinge helix DNA binding protein
MISGMTTTIDAGGKITIPQELLEEARLEPGTPVEITYRDGHIEIESAESDVHIEMRGRLAVLVPNKPIEEKLTAEQVDRIIEELREERINKIISEMLQENIDRRR